MTNFVIFTASTSNKQAYEHFVKTISNEYQFANSILLTEKQKIDLLKLYPSGKARFWGSRPGLKSQWDKLQSGDIVYIYQDGYHILSAVVTYYFHNPKFAEEVWGKDKETGQVWEYIYFLDDFETIQIRADIINTPLRYQPFAGFRVYEEEIWKSRLGEDFISEKAKEYEKITIDEFEEEVEEEIEKIPKTKEELLSDAYSYVATKPGYEKKLKELKERHDSETQKAIIKKLEDYSCQIDGFFIEYQTKKGKTRRYVEAAHILPKHKGGGESIKNIIVLCPNCHKKLDKNVITIDIDKKEVRENDKLITLHHDNHLFK